MTNRELVMQRLVNTFQDADNFAIIESLVEGTSGVSLRLLDFFQAQRAVHPTGGAATFPRAGRVQPNTQRLWYAAVSFCGSCHRRLVSNRDTMCRQAASAANSARC